MRPCVDLMEKLKNKVTIHLIVGVLKISYSGLVLEVIYFFCYYFTQIRKIDYKVIFQESKVNVTDKV